MLYKIFFAFLLIQIDLILWGLLCFMLLWTDHKIKKTSSFAANMQAMTTKRAAMGLIICEIIHLPITIILCGLFVKWQACEEFYFILLGINICLHIIRSISTIHYLPSIKKEL